MASLPDFLTSLHETSGLHIAQLCDHLGISARTWYSWRNGETVPARSKARQMATVLGKPELVALIDADRRELAEHRGQTVGTPARFPTPRTIVMDKPATPPGVA